MFVEPEDEETSSLVWDVFGGIPSAEIAFDYEDGDRFRSHKICVLDAESTTRRFGEFEIGDGAIRLCLIGTMPISFHLH